MKQYKLYTTESVLKVQQFANRFADDISQTPGRDRVYIEVYHYVPNKKDVKVIIDTDGDKVLDWSWFRNTFAVGREYDGYIFHFTPEYRKTWGVESKINGSRNKNNTDYPEFWICCKLSDYANGYKRLPEFMRLMYHEHAHFDEDIDDAVGNKLTQNTVHDMDYKLKKIHLYHLLVDYRGRSFKDKVKQVINRAISLIKHYVSNT